jgi:peptide/nickel transport system substrate-binding protein
MRSIATLLVALLLVTCSTPDGAGHEAVAGGKRYGGVFNANESEELRGLFPLSLVQAASHRLAAQIYEGLVRFDQRDLSILPALASSWTMDSTGMEYTFNLRQGVKFHDDACFADGVGREFTADDVVRCYTALCSRSDLNQMFWLFQDRVVGANAQYSATLKGGPGPGVSGIEAVDAYTVRFRLTAPWPSFPQVLAHQGCWIFPWEAVEAYGEEVRWHPVGTGAFRLKTWMKGEMMVLERSPGYWGEDEFGNKLPFLDAVRFTFVKDKNIELSEFENGKLSVVYELPVERTAILDEASDFQVQSVPGLTVQFYGFNTRRTPFNELLVRKAFSMAIDRQFIVDSVLNGLAVPARHGVVAPGFADYPYEEVAPTVYDPEAARALLAEAGHPGGEGLPTVYLQANSDGFGYVRVAGVVQGMLERELGVRVVSTVLPAEQHYERVEGGQAGFWREGWIVDHPDPENFLALFYGKNVPLDTAAPSYLNSTRYNNSRFDSLFAQAQRTGEHAERFRLLAQAEAQLMKDAVVIPLYHERSVRLLQPWVRDLPINGMEYRSLRDVWFDPKENSGQ